MFYALEINKNIFIATELRQKNKKFPVPVLNKKQQKTILIYLIIDLALQGEQGSPQTPGHQAHISLPGSSRVKATNIN